MKTHFKQMLYYLLLLISIGGCTLPLGNWWNSNYAEKFDEEWSPPKGMSSEQASEIYKNCYSMSSQQAENPTPEILAGYKKLKIDEKEFGYTQQDYIRWMLHEQCLLDHGLKFHPIGVEGNYANSCDFNHNKKLPACQSVGIFRKLGITLFNPWIN